MSAGIAAMVASVLAGAAFGALHLVLLGVATRALAGPHPARIFVLFALLRASLLVAALAGMAALGAGAAEFIGGLAGYLAARFLVIRGVRTGKGLPWR